MTSTYANLQIGGVPPDLKQIIAAIEQVNEIGKEIRASDVAIANWMSERGFDPADGCILVLPGKPADRRFALPTFVQFSPHVNHAYMLRKP